MIPSLNLTTTKANDVFLLELSGYGLQLIQRTLRNNWQSIWF